VALTVITRKNTANANLAISIGSGLTGEFVDASNSDSIAANDLYTIQVSSGAGSGAATLSAVALTFASSSGTVFRCIDHAVSAAGSASNSYYMSLGGIGGTATGVQPGFTESSSQATIRTNATINNLAVNVTGIASGTTITFRKNATDGNLTVNLTGTGITEDTSHSDTITPGDLCCWKQTNPAGGNTVIATIACDFSTTNNSWSVMSTHVAGQTVAASATSYATIGGDLRNSLGATEATVKLTSRLAFNASNLGISIFAYTITNPTTVDLRVNGSSSALTMSVIGTGITEDVTHTVTVAATDQINYRIAGGSGGTSLTVTGMWMVGRVFLGEVIGGGVGGNTILGG
jgi:hypothetical protein